MSQERIAGLRIGGLSADARSAISGLSIWPAQDLADQAHGRFASRAAHRRTRFLFALMEEHAQDQLHEPEPSLGLAVQEPVVAHAPQAGGRDVLQHAPEKVGYGELAISGAFGAGIDVAKGDRAVRRIMSDQIALANDAAIDLMTETGSVVVPGKQ